jgi:hypothetical protein
MKVLNLSPSTAKKPKTKKQHSNNLALVQQVIRALFIVISEK